MTAYKKVTFSSPCPACNGDGKIRKDTVAGLAVFVDCGVCTVLSDERLDGMRKAYATIDAKNAELRRLARERFES